MQKYVVSGILALLLVFACSDKAFAEGFTQTPAENAKTLKNWEASLVGKDLNKSSTADLTELVQAKDRNLESTILSKYTTNSEMLFTDMPKTVKGDDKDSKPTRWTSAQWTTMAERIEEMATLYKTPTSKYYYQKESGATLATKISYALDWYSNNIYSATIGVNGSNWYDNQIATPLSLVNTLVLMRGPDSKTEGTVPTEKEPVKISDDTFQKYMDAIDYFEPSTYNGTSQSGNVVGTAANRANKGFVVIMRGIVDSNPAKTQVGIDMLRRAYLTVNTGDGFYADGTFIQHSYVPYTTGYGADALARFADLYRLFDGTTGMKYYTGSTAIFNLLDKTYQPALYQDETLDMTRGRVISFEDSTSADTAYKMLYDMYTISSMNRQVGYTDKYYNMIKSAIFTKSLTADFYTNMSVPQAQTFQKLLQDGTVSNKYPEQTKNVMMSRANQMIDVKPEYTAGVSMFSKNTSAFEYMEGNNKIGFYTGTGVLSLYNGDRSFQGNYYPTVGMTSLPGTTTDLLTRDLTNDDSSLLYANTESWSGGISDGINGSASMDYTMKNVTSSNLQANKSWFFLDGKIVALGSNIENDGNRNTQTIVENRQLTSDSTQFSVNGTDILQNAAPDTVSQARWAYLDSSNPSQSIGYIFPYPTTVTAYKREQTGNWNELASRNKSKTVTSTYAGLTIPHGTNPVGSSYIYVILPGKSKEETKKAANTIGIGMADLTCINSSTTQGVLDESKKLLIYNYRKPVKSGFSGWDKDYSNSAYTPGSIMIRYTGNTKTVTLADPTMKQDSVRFSVPKENYTVPASSDNATIESSGDEWLITVDTSAKNGQSYSYTFEQSGLRSFAAPLSDKAKHNITFTPIQ
ncbi:polysaccharide lyase 8 family protein [Listeria booriae]|uniref:polysaccharide lyase 8 family protein n=1 Tax=Listeria booriae TaxID=1552123 RepID=UPI00164D7F4C|nr:polysaccharide lyase 8 family protein [Listeria booriae]MBC6300092.1 polysaccharide lyase 8 family protein [Listeria booriae]